jgi:CBS domain containing-hemolysin-like protein
MLLIFALFSFGLTLSAFFSGSETGFYRVPRARLLLDSKGGDNIARGLFWLSNNPTLFVATTLIGNNLANYLVSLSIVLAAAHFTTGDRAVFAIIAPVIMAPLVFVYGELLPKNLFFRAPYRLLHSNGMLFFAFGVLFSPISAVLWLFGRGLESLVGQAPLRLKRSIARNELRQIMQEGHDAGVLSPAQRDLAHNLISMAHLPVKTLCQPLNRTPWIASDASLQQARRMAKRHRVAYLPVRLSPDGPFLGYVRSVDLYLDDDLPSSKLRELPSLPDDLPFVKALLRMKTAGEEIVMVVDEQDQHVVGFLIANELVKPLFRTS